MFPTCIRIHEQKLAATASQQCDVLRAECILGHCSLSWSSLTASFVDEVGSDRSDCMWCFGYCLRGKPASVQKLLWCGRVSAIAVISRTGFIYCYTTIATINAETLEDFMLSFLSVLLSPLMSNSQQRCCCRQLCHTPHQQHSSVFAGQWGCVPNTATLFSRVKCN